MKNTNNRISRLEDEIKDLELSIANIGLLEKTIEKWDKEFWKHRQLLKKRVSVKCPVCNGTLLLWPLESESYYTSDGVHYHVKCYDQLLREKKQ